MAPQSSPPRDNLLEHHFQARFRRLQIGSQHLLLRLYLYHLALKDCVVEMALARFHQAGELDLFGEVFRFVCRVRDYRLRSGHTSLPGQRIGALLVQKELRDRPLRKARLVVGLEVVYVTGDGRQGRIRSWEHGAPGVPGTVFEQGGDEPLLIAFGVRHIVARLNVFGDIPHIALLVIEDDAGHAHLPQGTDDPQSHRMAG